MTYKGLPTLMDSILEEPRRLNYIVPIFFLTIVTLLVIPPIGYRSLFQEPPEGFFSEAERVAEFKLAAQRSAFATSLFTAAIVVFLYMLKGTYSPKKEFIILGAKRKAHPYIDAWIRICISLSVLSFLLLFASAGVVDWMVSVCGGNLCF